MSDVVYVGALVTISPTWLAVQPKWTRERWTARRATVMRIIGIWADLRDESTHAELAVPVAWLHLANRTPGPGRMR